MDKTPMKSFSTLNDSTIRPEGGAPTSSPATAECCYKQRLIPYLIGISVVTLTTVGYWYCRTKKNK